MLLALSSGSKLSDAFCKWLPEDVKLTDRRASALETNKNTAWGSYFELPDLYFGEMDGDRYILKHGMTGELIEKGNTVFSASRTDWTLIQQHARTLEVCTGGSVRSLEETGRSGPRHIRFRKCKYGSFRYRLSLVDEGNKCFLEIPVQGNGY